MDDERSVEPNKDWLVLMMILVIVAWALSAVLISAFFSNGSDRGTFGDMFGAVNALFSGFAFAGLIYTILLQKKELSLQRHELALTRGEMAGQRVQMESQAATLKLQQFESTFFQLLRVHGDIVNAIDLVRSNDGQETKGRDCFKVFCKRFDSQMLRNFNSQTEAEQIRSAYAAFYGAHEAEVGHYFRHLYHVIKFVDSSGIDDKRRYTSFVRAQISSYELQLLFYNCLSEQGNLYFKPLIEKYGLLKHLPKTVDDRRRNYYKPEAFQSAVLKVA